MYFDIVFGLSCAVVVLSRVLVLRGVMIVSIKFFGADQKFV